VLISKSLSENVGQASSLTVRGASVPRLSGGRMPPEPADKMSAPHYQPGSKRQNGGRLITGPLFPVSLFPWPL